MRLPFRTVLLLLLPALAASSCSHTRRTASEDVRPCPSPQGCVTFRVSGGAGAEEVHDSPVLLVSASGISRLGATDADGVILLPKDTLTTPGLSAILFCWDERSLACTAIRLDSGTVTSYDWLNVSLPSNRLIHRSQAVAVPHATPIPPP